MVSRNTNSNTPATDGRLAMGRGRASNPVHRARLCEVWGRGKPESASRWDEIMRRLYDEHGITTQRQLASATGIPESTLRSCDAFKSPSRMRYGIFLRMCEGLNADVGELTDEYIGLDHEAAKKFDEAFEAAKTRTLELATHFLSLSAEQQETVLRMAGAVDGSNNDGMHARACALLNAQLSDLAGRCKSWHYIDLS